eukprot:7586226-Alexandrium_andersonii.AAC.1
MMYNSHFLAKQHTMYCQSTMPEHRQHVMHNEHSTTEIRHREMAPTGPRHALGFRPSELGTHRLEG